MDIFRRKVKFSLVIDRKVESNGIQLSIKQAGNLINLPVRLTVSEVKRLENLDQLQLVEDLYTDNKITQMTVGTYLLAYDEVYNLSPEERAMLHLPKEFTKLKVELDNQSFVGSKDFKFIPKVHSEKYANLHLAAVRKGAIIVLSTNEYFLMDREHYLFLESVENKPGNDNIDDLFHYIAKIKKQAKDLGISVNEHIDRENYEFIDEVDINVERTKTGIDINPIFKHDSLDRGELHLAIESTTGYVKTGNKRIFVDNKAKIKNEQIQSIGFIEEQDIPRFVQNPIAFIPEEIDISLEDFGERVKSLGIRVYKAQPFVNAVQSNNGWFEYETGFEVRDNEGNSITKQDQNFFTNENSDFKKLDENTFIELPEQVKEFQELSSKIQEEASTNPTRQLTPSNYILEIFENINHVEFNRPLNDMREILSKQQVFDENPPSSFAAVLKPFQRDGFRWMKTLRTTGSGGLLADDMGLGKTIQVIAYLAYLKEMNQLTPSLLVLPKSLIENWVNEMKQFAPILTENLYIHTGPNRLKDHASISKYDIVLTTYQTLTRDQLIMGRIDWEMVICDEAQSIKNPSTATSIAIKALKNRGRLALTGTPVENSLSDLWSIVDYVQPGTLGSLKEFKNEYEKKLEDEKSFDDIQESIEKKIYFIYKRRTKSEELKGQIPDKFERRLLVSMGKDQANLYSAIISQIKSKEIPAIQGIMKLKMLCSHPGLIDNSLSSLNPKKVPKLMETIQLLKVIKAKNEKVLIFTEYRIMQAILKKTILNEFDINPAIINGSTNRRQEVIDQFNQSPGFAVLILSPKAAGTGLTITSANHVIHYTRWWNPAVENQATDRVYRIGQDKEVQVYYPIISGGKDGKSVEEVVDSLLARKNEMAQNVIIPSRNIDIDEEIIGSMQNL